jgi:hypothetical protein
MPHEVRTRVEPGAVIREPLPDITQATEEQNERVRRILDVLQQTGQNIDPETDQPLINLPARIPAPDTEKIKTFQGPGGAQGSPGSQQPGQRRQFIEALQRDPQNALQQLQQLSQQFLKGVPQPAQKEVLGQLGVTPPEPKVPTEHEIRAAAAGFNVPGVTKKQAQTFMREGLMQEMGKFELEQSRREAGRNAPPGIFLDAQGVPYTPTFGRDIMEGTSFYRQNSPQQQVFSATGIINSHVDQTLDKIQGIAKGDRNRFTQLLYTQLQRFTNDPRINTLIQFLGPATALAVASAYSAGGTSIRGGVRLAEMFQEGVYSPGDTLQTALTKLRTLQSLALENATHINLHPNVVKSIRQRINTIDDLLEPAGGSMTRMRTPSGREMWFPPDKVQRAKELGAVEIK